MVKGKDDTIFYLLGRLQAGLTTFVLKFLGKRRSLDDDASIMITRITGTL